MAESELGEGFEKNRTRLRAVAYRMLGSLAEADDAVQEAWLRLIRSYASGVDNLGASVPYMIGPPMRRLFVYGFLADGARERRYLSRLFLAAGVAGKFRVVEGWSSRRVQRTVRRCVG
jgi:hypothetical protein